MGTPSSLKGRSLEILKAVIRAYIASGEPVGSRTLSERRKDGLSPASIRNVMAELEAAGYLSHPHTSAGRIPTEKGLRSYVESVKTPRLQAAEADFVEANLGGAATAGERVLRSSHVLAALTHQLGIVVSAPLSQAVLEHIQFMVLSQGRLLVILVARGEVVEHRIIRVGIEMQPEELTSIANYLNRNFAGWKLAAARAEILRRIEQERAAYDAILGRLRLLYLAGFLPEAEAQICVEGTPNLVDGIDAGDAERLRSLLEALEEKQKLVGLLDQCLREDMRLEIPRAGDEKLFVRIGLEGAYPAMRNLALIGAICPLDGGAEGRIAVIGPMRMHYERVLSAVLHVARAVSQPREAGE